MDDRRAAAEPASARTTPTTGDRLAVRVVENVPIPLDASFACESGELLALTGPSGSGKSTLLRCIAGLERGARGRIACGDAVWLDSERGLNLVPQQRSVGIVFQQYALFPHLTALRNVEAALGHRPRATRASRARELLASVHLSGLEDRRPSQLSGGQQQRVAMARALARDPQVLLLDEPFAAVDRVTRQKLYRELAELRRTLAMPIVLVTHDLDEAAMLADRIGVMSARPGVIIEVVETHWPRERDSRIVENEQFGAVTSRLWKTLRDESMKTMGRTAISP